MLLELCDALFDLGLLPHEIFLPGRLSYADVVRPFGCLAIQFHDLRVVLVVTIIASSRGCIVVVFKIQSI